MKIAILDSEAIGPIEELKRFDKFGEVKTYSTTNEKELFDRAKNKDVLILNKVRMDSSVLKKLPDLKLICVCATGTDNVDLEYCNEKGIEVKNVKGYSTDSVSQLTVSMVLALSLRLSEQNQSGKSKWQDSPVFSVLNNTFEDISDKSWGIVGLGSIGKKVARTATTMGCDVKYFSTTGRNSDPEFTRVELDALLGCNIISIHCPLNENTKDLINASNVSKLKDDCILINVARGGVVNERAIVDYFNKSNIKLGFDVASKEPIQGHNPLLEIRDSERLILTPHIAWASRQARQRLLEGVEDNIRAFIE